MESSDKHLSKSGKCSWISICGSELDRFKFGKNHCNLLYLKVFKLFIDGIC